MRYTLRLLTLDQLARAAGVVCALELMRTNPINIDEKGRRRAAARAEWVASQDKPLETDDLTDEPPGPIAPTRRDATL